MKFIKLKSTVTLLFFVLIMSSFSKSKISQTIMDTGALNSVIDTKKNGNAGAMSSENLIINTKNQTIKAYNGIKFQYQGVKLEAFELQKEKNLNIIKATKNVKVELDSGVDKIRIDSDRLLLSTDSDIFKYYNSFSYMNVGHVTGAIYPNDKIYFGGEVGEYNKDEFSLKNAWFTTDFNILKNHNYKTADYYIKSKELSIIPDNKATFYNLNLYIKNYKVFWFPWYAVNIRQGSEVPLFPEWGNDVDQGFYVTTGVNYGNKKSKYLKGGVAPKFADKLGFLIGRSENWYDLGNYGKGEITADDLLVVKKDSSVEDRWNINETHQYRNKKGNLKFGFRSTTVNEIPALEDYRDALEARGYYDPNNSNYIGYSRNDGDQLNFLTLNSEFKNIGKRDDTTIKAKVKLLVKGEKAYRQLVDNQMDDASFGSQLDHKLYSDLSLIKDNSDYTLSSYYNYLKDLDPGSTSNVNDNQSKRENFGVGFKLKKSKIQFNYDHKNGDKLRLLRAWERSPDLESLITIQGKSIKYLPWSVAKYDKDNSDNIKSKLGSYNLGTNGTKYNIVLNSKNSETELNLDDDVFRTTAKTNNSYFNKRDQEYNKENNIIYNKSSENSIATNFLYEQYSLGVTFGHLKEEKWDREGIYNYLDLKEKDAYNIYKSESDFVQILLDNKELNLGTFGKSKIKYNIRYDSYTKGYDTYSGDNSGGDSTLRHQIDFNHKVTLFDNTQNYFRYIDLKLGNEFNYFGQLYSYNNGDKFSNSQYQREVRMKYKNNINQFKDKITLNIGNTKTIYSAKYRQKNDSLHTDIKKGNKFYNNIDFLINNEKKFYLYYNLDNRYTRGELTDHGYQFNREHNDLTNYKFGWKYYLNKNYRFYYNKEQIDYDLLSSPNSSISSYSYNYPGNEKAVENKYGLEIINLKDIYNLYYTNASDDRTDNNINTINIKNNTLGASYLKGGDVEHFYSGSYGVYKYGPAISLKNYSGSQMSFTYQYRDKRFSKDDLKSYAASEYNKSRLKVTPDEVSRIREILNKRNDRQLDFHLNSIMDEEMNHPEYKKYFNLTVMTRINTEAYNHNNDLFNSLKQIKGSIYGSYKRVGLGYTFNQEANFNGNYERVPTTQDMEFKFIAGIGKPSQGWNIKLYYKTQISNQDEYGVYLGKAMGFYEWSIGYSKNYDRINKTYDDRIALQFTLLTFPQNPLFGLGFKDDTGKISPNLWLGNGVNADVTN